MESEKAEETGKKKRWTVEEKARIIRRYLKDHVGLADLAEETGTSPGLILQWAKQALEELEQTFSRETHRQRKVLHREILEKEDRIRKLESVVSELSTENLTLKKSLGPSHRNSRRSGNDGGGLEDRPVFEEEGRISHQKVPGGAGAPVPDLPSMGCDPREGKAPGRRPSQGTPDSSGGAGGDPGLQEKTSLPRGQAPVFHDAGPECRGRVSFKRLESLAGRRSLEQMDGSRRPESAPEGLSSTHPGA